MGKPNKLAAPASAELSPDTFKSAMQTARRLFASKGIKSKADAYQLINQGFAEKRFTEADMRGLQHAVSLVFDDNSFKLAQTLINAKERGLKLAKQKRAAGTKSAKPIGNNKRTGAYSKILKGSVLQESGVKLAPQAQAPEAQAPEAEEPMPMSAPAEIPGE